MKVYLVGGAVRDELLDRDVTERDWVVVGATPDTLLDLGYTQVGKDFPVFLHPETKDEYALARTERKSGSGYTGFICNADPSVTLEDDLMRRDLTVNAIAKSQDGELIDPYGGLDDLAHKVLRHVSDAFVEDPLRVLRVARFAARYAYLGFTVAPSTLKLMQHIAHSGELESLSSQRVWQETKRAIMERSPSTYFSILSHTGGLDYWFAELVQDGHTQQTLADIERVEDALTDEAARMAFLTQHLSEAQCNALLTRLTVPNTVKHLCMQVSKHVSLFDEADTLRSDTLITLFNNLDVWRKPDFLPQVVTVLRAIWLLRDNESVARQRQATILRAAAAASRVDVQGIIAQGFKGPQIREQLVLARTQAIDEIIANP